MNRAGGREEEWWSGRICQHGVTGWTLIPWTEQVSRGLTYEFQELDSKSSNSSMNVKLLWVDSKDARSGNQLSIQVWITSLISSKGILLLASECTGQVVPRYLSKFPWGEIKIQLLKERNRHVQAGIFKHNWVRDATWKWDHEERSVYRHNVKERIPEAGKWQSTYRKAPLWLSKATISADIPPIELCPSGQPAGSESRIYQQWPARVITGLFQRHWDNF